MFSRLACRDLGVQGLSVIEGLCFNNAWRMIALRMEYYVVSITAATRPFNYGTMHLHKASRNHQTKQHA